MSIASDFKEAAWVVLTFVISAAVFALLRSDPSIYVGEGADRWVKDESPVLLDVVISMVAGVVATMGVAGAYVAGRFVRRRFF